MRRVPIDEEKLGRLYRAGQLSMREMANQCNCGVATIDRLAKKHGWQRDLSAQVIMETRRQLVTTKPVSPNHPACAAQTDAEIVEAAAAVAVNVVRSHRADIESGRKAVRAMLDELTTACENIDQIEEDIDKETEDDVNPKRRQAMLKAVSLYSRSSTVSNLSTALQKLVALEREAFGIRAGEDEADSYEARLKRLMETGSE